MMRALVITLALATPALAQDDRPPYQLLEGIGACLLAGGDVAATSAAFAAFQWTAEADAEMGLVNFAPALGEDTFAYMSDTVDFCQVESLVMGTDAAAGLLELFRLDNPDPIEVTDTGTDDMGCPTQTLSNGIVVGVTSAGNDPTCTSDTDSAIRFLFP